MDDIKITIRTTIEGTATETTYMQQMPAHNQQAMPVQNAASSGCRRHSCRRNKYITIKSPIIGTFIESQPRQTYVC
jgi:acetyl-CoA carboxylase biotin carboxyl carrier protein